MNFFKNIYNFLEFFFCCFFDNLTPFSFVSFKKTLFLGCWSFQSNPLIFFFFSLFRFFILIYEIFSFIFLPLIYSHCQPFIIAFCFHFGDVINIVISLMLLNVSFLLSPLWGLFLLGSCFCVFLFVCNVLFGVFFLCQRFSCNNWWPLADKPHTIIKCWKAQRSCGGWEGSLYKKDGEIFFWSQLTNWGIKGGFNHSTRLSLRVK